MAFLTPERSVDKGSRYQTPEEVHFWLERERGGGGVFSTLQKAFEHHHSGHICPLPWDR